VRDWRVCLARGWKRGRRRLQGHLVVVMVLGVWRHILPGEIAFQGDQLLDGTGAKLTIADKTDLGSADYATFALNEVDDGAKFPLITRQIAIGDDHQFTEFRSFGGFEPMSAKRGQVLVVKRRPKGVEGQL